VHGPASNARGVIQLPFQCRLALCTPLNCVHCTTGPNPLIFGSYVGWLVGLFVWQLSFQRRLPLCAALHCFHCTTGPNPLILGFMLVGWLVSLVVFLFFFFFFQVSCLFPCCCCVFPFFFLLFFRFFLSMGGEL
jgi:hypothetical protein